MYRRQFLKLLISSGVLLSGPGCSQKNTLLDSRQWPPLQQNPLPFAGLATSLPEEHDYVPHVEGTLPSDLKGILYRNGPGLFDRGNDRKCMILDGDGMVQAFSFSNGSVRYRNRFVRTPKYVEEEAAGRFLYATWATHASGGILANFAASVENQAGVTVIRRGNRLFAFDEAKLPYELDPDTLETEGLTNLGDSGRKTGYNAHWRVDGKTGEWLLCGMGFGIRGSIEISMFKNSGQFNRSFIVPAPRRTYMHDWLASERYLIFILHPGIISISSILQMVFGLIRPASIIQWKPELGNLVIIADREGKEKPIMLEAESAWMWHGLNAYERNGLIIVDFCGAAEATGVGGDETPFFQIMEGKNPFTKDTTKGPLLRRYIIDLAARKLKEEILESTFFHEFPFVNQRLTCHRHRYGYFTRFGGRVWFPSWIDRIDTETGGIESYFFGEGQYCTEPIFVPKPSVSYDGISRDEPGYILTLVYNGKTKKSYLAVLLADRISEGPQAIVHLRHHVPLSFHGFWYPEV